MVTEISQGKRRRMLQSAIGMACLPLGFSHHSKEYFIRPRGPITDVFFFQQSRANTQYTITYGVDCPGLLPYLRGNDILSLDVTPKLIVSGGRLEHPDVFACKYLEQVQSSAEKVAAALQNEAQPWFARFDSERDVINHYQAIEISANLPSQSIPPGKMLRWIMYGLMLLGVGDKSGIEWLEPVLHELRSKSKPSSHEREWIRIIEDNAP